LRRTKVYNLTAVRNLQTLTHHLLIVWRYGAAARNWIATGVQERTQQLAPKLRFAGCGVRRWLALVR
jgi:hypothetical protein